MPDGAGACWVRFEAEYGCRFSDHSRQRILPAPFSRLENSNSDDVQIGDYSTVDIVKWGDHSNRGSRISNGCGGPKPCLDLP
jgi:hypothetical protein